MGRADPIAALDDFMAACAALEHHRAALPASLVALASAAHTFAAVEAKRQQGQHVTALDAGAELAALDDLKRTVGALG